MDTQLVTQLENALDALGRGFAVFPCYPRTKEPAGKVVPHGVLQASTNEATIREWWKRNPEFNPAITNGVIVDADSGLNSLQEAKNFALLNDFPPTLIVRTGRRDSYGAQFHFTGTAVNGLYTANNVRGEVRCKNEYGMAPGAIHPVTGERYEIVVDLPRAVCPADLLKKFRKAAPSSKAPKPGFKVGEGERYYWLRSQCGRLVNAGLSGPALFAALKSLNEQFCVPPKPDSVLQELTDAGTEKFTANVEPPDQGEKAHQEALARIVEWLASDDTRNPEPEDAYSDLGFLTAEEYELFRKKAAKRLGIRPAALDGFVKKRHSTSKQLVPRIDSNNLTEDQVRKSFVGPIANN